MFKRSMKKLACGVLAVLSVTACMSTFTACETAHPEVKMTIEFNGTPYELEYQLYRNVAPSTTKHFLWLVANDYYDGLCVHDYSADKMYTGVYSYDADNEEAEGGLVYKKYYETVDALNKTKTDAEKFPVSVYKLSEKTAANAMYNLYGEFEDNKFKVENGDKSEAFGSLTMYYNSKASNDDRVYVVRNDGEETLAARDYKYNSATSQFYITMGETTTNNMAYCTFAYLMDDEDNKQELLDLKKAIEDAVAAKTEEGASFTEAHSIETDKDDPFGAGMKKTFKVPTQAIVIKDIEILSL